MFISFVVRTIEIDNFVVNNLRRMCVAMDSARLQLHRVNAMQELFGRNPGLKWLMMDAHDWITEWPFAD